MILKHIYVEDLVVISSDVFLWGCGDVYSHFKGVGIDAFSPPATPNDYEYSDINLDVLIGEIKRV